MSNENISIEKSFPVGVNELYKAWTDEAALKEWWQPAGKKLKAVEADLKEGGTIIYTFEGINDGKEQLTIEGTYETVVPYEQLIYTWNWKLADTPVENGAYKLTVNFEAANEGSKIKVAQESEADQEGIHPHEEGWANALNDLEKYLS